MGSFCTSLCYYDNQSQVEFKIIKKIFVIKEKYICTFILPKKPRNTEKISYVYSRNNQLVYFHENILFKIIECIFEKIGENIICNRNNNCVIINIDKNTKLFDKMEKKYKYQNDDKYYYFDIYSKYESYDNRQMIMKQDLVDRYYFLFI
jgi:hypothetical protein